MNVENLVVFPSSKIKGKINITIQTDMQNFEYVNEIVSAFNKGRNITFNLELTSEKKTVPANAYLWQLCHKIATKIGGLTKEDVYKDAIKAKGVFQYIQVDNFEEFNARWSKLGTGWFCEEVSVDNYVNAYYGSSTYNKKELANVIDFVVEVAKEQGIETLTEREREEMLKLVP
jgi:sulfatase maturation enzyme AslB (radical SAM superfamily)